MNSNAEDSNRYKYIIDHIRDIIWETDTELLYTYVSPSAKETVGYDPLDMIGKSILYFFTQESKERVRRLFTKGMKESNGKPRRMILFDVQFIAKDGRVLWFEVSISPVYRDEALLGFVGSSRDMTEKKAQEEELRRYIDELSAANRKLEDLANYDMLTDAYNRRKFEEYAELLIRKKEQYDCPFSIIMFDIDDFKKINDQSGHKTGDDALQEMTAIVKDLLRNTDLLFRWGGDEFIVLLQDTTANSAAKVAEKLRKTVEESRFSLPGGRVTVSMGVGEYRTGESPEDFVLRIDGALFKAKFNGRNRMEIG